MGKKKKGLNNKIITVYHPITDEDFDVYVTYTFYKEVPEWVTEDMVYQSLIEELEEDHLWDDEEEDYEEEDLDDEEDENW